MVRKNNKFTAIGIWKNFIDSLESGSKLFEAGCGNGKNLTYRKDIQTYGCDISSGLIDVCRKNQN